MRLTAKQKLFADEYIKSGNATQSAIKAGYAVKAAHSMGTENLQKPAIKSYIDAKMAEIESHKIADAKEVLQYLTRVLRGEEMEEIPDNVDGGIIERKPMIRDRTEAAREIMKRYPLNDPLVAAQLKKLQAEAKITEQKAEFFKHSENTGITKIVFSDDLKPDKEDDTDQKGDESDGTDAKSK